MQSAAEMAETDPGRGSVLWRHVRAQAARRAAERPGTALPEPPPPAPARTPERAIAGAIGRAADRIHGLPMFFDRIDTGHAVLAEMAELLPEQALILVVEGPGDSLGVAAIDPGLLTSLIEMQAVGRISARSAAVRRPTRTDAAICADFLNACLAELGVELAGQRGFQGLGGYRYASFLEDPRPLELLLDDVPFRRIAVQLRAGAAGQRDGQILFFLPAAPAQAALQAEAAPPPVAAADIAPLPPPSGVLSGAVHAAPITLYGVLCRRMITLGELQALVPGSVVTLPPDVLGAATLETASGQSLYRGKLGEVAGRHALRLQAPQAGRGGEGVAGTTDGFGTGQGGDFDAGFGAADGLTGLGAAEELTSGGFGLDSGFGAGENEAPIDLGQPDPFRPDDLIDLAAPMAFPAEDGEPAADLSAWEDAEPAPLAPLSIG